MVDLNISEKKNHTSPFRQYDPIWSNIIQCRLPGVYCGCVRVCYYMMFVVVMFVLCIALDWFTVGWVPAPDCVLHNFGLFLQNLIVWANSIKSFSLSYWFSILNMLYQ
jgi:hypothetical protein